MAGARHPEQAGEPAWPIAAVLASGACASALGALTVLGWALEVPLLRGFRRDTIPMAPSTALLLILQGAALMLRARPETGRRAVLTSAVLGAATMVAALALLALNALGIRTSVEHLGMTITGDVGGVPTGHMSPLTAGCLLLSGISLLLSPSQPTPRSLRKLLAFGSAGVLTGTSLVPLLAYLYGRPLLDEGGFIPPAVNTALALAALGLGLLVMAGRRGAVPWELHERARMSGWFLLVFIMLASGMIAAGYLYFHDHEVRYRAEEQRQLSAIADLKVSELGQWRRERLGDGAVFLGNEVFSELMRRCVEAPGDRRSRALLGIWLRRVREAYQYDRVFAVDRSGAEVAAFPAAPEPLTAFHRSVFSESLRDRRVRLLDFHRDGPGLPVHLSVLVPILTAAGEPLGVVVLRIDPATELYPIIQRWPTASRSAETLIVRREGGEALFLNELRFREGTALSLRAPLTNRRMPAVAAALGGEGSFEGVDYRGVEVIAELRQVPDSPWALVARLDAAEVYAPLRESLWMMIVLVVGLVSGAGAVLGFVQRQQVMGFYRERYETTEALRASEAELRQRNEELTRFTYTVSHDLKSPLVTIQTFLGYLEQDLGKQDEASAAKDFGFIRTAAQKMSRLLDELLELSRVGRSRNPAESIRLAAVAEEALALVAGRIAGRRVRVDVTQEPVVLHGDRVRLVEVFQNLLDNAVKFMGEQPEPRVEIGAEEVDGELVLFVRDNGAGIDPRHQAKLFGLFEKLDPKSEGTGIGLALVRRIIEVHGGRIWAESGGPGQGACFRFTLAGTSRPPRRETA